MKKLTVILLAAVLSLPAGSRATEKGKTPERTEREKAIVEYVRELERDSLMGTTSWSVVIKDVRSGRVIAQHAPRVPLSGASITKLLTTGAALTTLGPEFRYETKLSYCGTIRDSTLYGTLYVTGGGDPSLGSDYRKFLPSPDSLLSVWKRALNDAGIARIEGKMVADSRYFSFEPAIGTWEWGDLDTYYGTGVHGLSFFDNKFVIAFAPADRPGEKAGVQAFYPEVPGVAFINRSVTVKGREDGLYLNISPLHPLEHFIGGTLGAESGKVHRAASNRAPELTLLHEFNKRIHGGSGNPQIEYEVWNSFSESVEEPAERIQILNYPSPELKTIVAVTNKYSDNMYAETIFRTLGKQLRGSDSRDDSRLAEMAVLDSIAPGSAILNLRDGSGLSYASYLNADYYTDFLIGMAGTPVFECFLASLAVPGEEGTLKYILQGHPTGKNLHVKSGTLSGARAFSGYSRNGEELLCFAIIVNRFHSVTPIAPRLHRLLELISEY